ncbi:hypothetical protein LTR54_018257 [Friedmanniomyces endolithicus]|uniref:Uncharacterized protein n=1 Tax=Friedmanniomyces endolithicus TaxID=329885 RepID=A0AAN6IZ13_9PEZI|nr:hypothetical protein LTR82_018184 [Friedmanniomyces endolithicus]KAK0967747.1 hypothetical protein LTR54_018257 [Friedmanniomyces endolithicus]
MSPIPEDTPMYDANNCHFAMSPDKCKLYDINNIKYAMRLWVQTRLLDAEHELKRQRRRRASTPTITLSSAGEEAGYRWSSS